MKTYQIVLVVIGLFMASCGSIKKTEKSDLTVNQVSTVKLDSSQVKQTETKIYGDTLTGTSFFPVFLNGIDTVGSDSAFVESAGIKLKIKVTPKKDKAGVLIGNQVYFNAIAKPVAATSINEVKQTKATSTTQTDTKLKINTTTDTKAGFSIPSWVWWLIALIVLLVATAFVKPLINKIK